LVARDDITAFLDKFLEVDRVRDDFQNGLVFSGKPDIFTIGMAANATLKVIRACVRNRVDFLLTHHGGWREIDLENFDSKIKMLERHHIALYVAHASLDISEKLGTANALAKLLDASVEGRFAEYCGGKAGVYGPVESIPFKELSRKVAQRLRVRVHAWKNASLIVNRIGIVTGAGYKTEWLREAKQLGCDTYITGEGNVFTKIYSAEAGLNLILAGHTATERPGIIGLGTEVQKRFPSLKAVEISEPPL